MTGQTIAHYKVGAKIGAGGMGEVYQATDTKLNREVALKILPEQFAKDHDRMSRFKREAQVLASLNHPNIAAIHGLEQEGDTLAIALELVEGPTLAERIGEGALALEETLNIVKQIAEALEAAHEQGVIHRDLKPANVKVKEDGQVKVLDFGLAKALEGGDSEEDVGNSPTLSIAATQAGMILGTAAYMSPEQARGQKADKRSDVWSFGVVLFEMLTGKRLFTGDTISDVLAAVLRAEADWDALPEDTPPPIRKLLRRCLTRERKQRLQAIGEARIGIDEFLENPVDASVLMSAASVAQPEPGWKRLLPWAFGAAMTLVAILAVWSPWETATPTSTMRLKVEIAPEETLFTGQGAAAVLSPDGKMLAYVAISSGTRELYIRPLDQLEGAPLSGTEGASDPFFSPDGRWIAFFTGNELKKVSVTGGAPLTLCSTEVNRGGTWGPDDTIVFAPHVTTGLSRVPAAGGTPEEITTRSEGERSHRWPYFLPDGKAVLFMAQDQGGSYDDATIEVVVLATGERKVIHEGGTYPRYLPSGHLVYAREGTLFAAPFDVNRLEITGQPAPVLEGVVSLGASAGNGGTQFAFSPGGTMVYVPGEGFAGGWHLARADRSGDSTVLPSKGVVYLGPTLSPDGKRVAVEIALNTNDLWVYEIERGTRSRLTFQGDGNKDPDWTPDGKRIAFASDRDGVLNLYWKRSDGAGEAERLTTSKNQQRVPSFSPDGKLLAFMEENSETSWDLWVLDLEGERKAEPFLVTPALEAGPTFSPDGRWIAYGSNESGRFEVYVRPFPGPGGKWQVSTDGITDIPHWSPDGSRIYYRNGERIMVVAVSGRGDSFQTGKPVVLFEGTYASGGQESVYDLSPDGKRFVMLKSGVDAGEKSDRRHLTLVFNWFDEVRNRLETGGR